MSLQSPPQSPLGNLKSMSPRVLLVDDEPAVLRSFAKLLSANGFDVAAVENGQAAIEAMDISMPTMDGLDLLRAIRNLDLDVPVVMHTAAPSVDSAAQSLELGAFRYLTKPVRIADFLETVRNAVAVCGVARARRELLSHLGEQERLMADRAGLEVRFNAALEHMWMAFQPIVRWSTRRIHAYEALVRSNEKSLPHPGAIFDAAEQLSRLSDVGRATRTLAPHAFASASDDSLLFLNLHVKDLADPSLYDEGSALVKLASRVVLEITERASLDEIDDARQRVSRLRELGFRIALDDLGAGFAGLSSFAALEPDVVKIDMSLVRDVHREPTKQRLVGTIVTLCQSMNRELVAEGVESVDELYTLISLGCDLFQGYLFARPGKPFPAPVFPSLAEV
jgi:EAL domain-containing protein (putative c-di-GMP-specific phosphodiesterase class I)/CheY-like chemotaxis protein